VDLSSRPRAADGPERRPWIRLTFVGREGTTEVRSEQPYNDSLTLDQAQLHDVLLAYKLDGRPLSRPHGAPARIVIRFSRTERAVHWVYASAFVVLLVSGLCLDLPSLAEAIRRRLSLKTIHVYTAFACVAGPLSGHRPRQPPASAHDRPRDRRLGP
jgi:Oxidoreductase molybdopterin binding domain